MNNDSQKDPSAYVNSCAATEPSAIEKIAKQIAALNEATGLDHVATITGNFYSIETAKQMNDQQECWVSTRVAMAETRLENKLTRRFAEIIRGLEEEKRDLEIKLSSAVQDIKKERERIKLVELERDAVKYREEKLATQVLRMGAPQITFHKEGQMPTSTTGNCQSVDFNTKRCDGCTGDAQCQCF
jgi:hypothetical protein